MKKIIFILFILCLFQGTTTYALDLSAECAYLMTAQGGECLYEKNGNLAHSIASTTKIITAITALEQGEIAEVVRVSANAASQEGSSIYLRTGNTIVLKDLLYGMMLNSGNDAACAVAEHVGGSVEEFANLMNQTAKKAGATNSSFKNPSGLDEEGHFSTAEDMAKIAAYAMKNEMFCEIASTKTSQINVGSDICYLKNHNKLLWNYEGCIGLKTGFTKKTGRCLVSAAERDGIVLIAVTLDAPDDWNDHKKLLDYGFENTEHKTVVKKGEALKTISGDNFNFNAVAKDGIEITSVKNSNRVPEVVLHTVKKPTTKILQGEKVGFAEVFFGEEKIGEVDLITDSNVEIEEKKESIFSEFFVIIKIIIAKVVKL